MYFEYLISRIGTSGESLIPIPELIGETPDMKGRILTKKGMMMMMIGIIIQGKGMPGVASFC